ncbi:hypothetical protein NYF45_002949 [Salmonella enterica]|nr:hypothetical protein [Salmonella enterica subsp. enterica serovar Oranienburg]EJR2897576.1 hypothetical protein [Salmonella enterica]EJY1541521.1 hypothetical protein [Salmonella enterica]
MWNINSELGMFILLEKFISPVEADIVAGRLQAEGVSVISLEILVKSMKILMFSAMSKKHWPEN